MHQIYWTLRREDAFEPVRTRIYAVTLYDMRLLLDGEDATSIPTLDDKAQTLLTPRFRNSAAPLILRPESEDVGKWLLLFLKFGLRMKAVALRNGGLGALVVLPSPLLSIRQ